MCSRVWTSTYYTATGSTTPPPAPAVGGPTCEGPDCGKTVTGPSDWFCGQDCQARWLQLDTYRPEDVLSTGDTAADRLRAIAEALDTPTT